MTPVFLSLVIKCNLCRRDLEIERVDLVLKRCCVCLVNEQEKTVFSLWYIITLEKEKKEEKKKKKNKKEEKQTKEKKKGNEVLRVICINMVEVSCPAY